MRISKNRAGILALSALAVVALADSVKSTVSGTTTPAAETPAQPAITTTPVSSTPPVTSTPVATMPVTDLDQLFKFKIGDRLVASYNSAITAEVLARYKYNNALYYDVMSHNGLFEQRVNYAMASEIERVYILRY